MVPVAKIGGWFLGTLLVAGGILSSQGFVHVRVEEQRKNGTHLRLVVPAMVVPIALKLVPGRDIADGASQVRPWLPAIDAAAEGLGNCADGPLVEVDDPSEWVSVVKSGGSLVVDVSDPNEHVYVSVPIATLQSAANALASRAEPDRTREKKRVPPLRTRPLEK